MSGISILTSAGSMLQPTAEQHNTRWTFLAQVHKSRWKRTAGTIECLGRWLASVVEGGLRLAVGRGSVAATTTRLGVRETPACATGFCTSCPRSRVLLSRTVPSVSATL